MLLLVSVFYIVFFTHYCLCRFAPCFEAASDERVRIRTPRVGVFFIIGAVLYAAAWAIVLSVTIGLMYGW